MDGTIGDGWSEAFAPASVGNVAVGFDLMGHALIGPGDIVRVRRTAEPGVQIAKVGGVVPDLPLDSGRNTAGAALMAMCAGLESAQGFEVEIEKGIALGSGMGGSGASAAAAVFAANALLDDSLELEALLPFALAGEAAATGAPCVDNVAPALAGGLVFVPPGEPRRIVRIRVPESLWCAVVRPELVIETRATRAVLEAPWGLDAIVGQTARLAGVRRSMRAATRSGWGLGRNAWMAGPSPPSSGARSAISAPRSAILRVAIWSNNARSRPSATWIRLERANTHLP